MPAGAEAGQAADRCWGCRGWARSGQGPDEMPAGRNRVAAGRDGSGQMLAGAEAGTGQDADDQITGAGGGLGATRDRARCRREPRLGLDEMPTTKSPGQAAEPPGIGVGGNQINSKENAL